MNCLYRLRMPSLLEFFKKLKCYNSSITRVRSITFQPACFKRLSMISFLVSFSFFTFKYTVIYSWSKYAKLPFLSPRLNILNRLIICEFNADRMIMDQGTTDFVVSSVERLHRLRRLRCGGTQRTQRKLETNL